MNPRVFQDYKNSAERAMQLKYCEERTSAINSILAQIETECGEAFNVIKDSFLREYRNMTLKTLTEDLFGNNVWWTEAKEVFASTREYLLYKYSLSEDVVRSDFNQGGLYLYGECKKLIDYGVNNDQAVRVYIYCALLYTALTTERHLCRFLPRANAVQSPTESETKETTEQHRDSNGACDKSSTKAWTLTNEQKEAISAELNDTFLSMKIDRFRKAVDVMKERHINIPTYKQFNDVFPKAIARNTFYKILREKGVILEKENPEPKKLDKLN